MHSRRGRHVADARRASGAAAVRRPVRGPGDIGSPLPPRGLPRSPTSAPSAQRRKLLEAGASPWKTNLASSRPASSARRSPYAGRAAPGAQSHQRLIDPVRRRVALATSPSNSSHTAGSGRIPAASSTSSVSRTGLIAPRVVPACRSPTESRSRADVPMRPVLALIEGPMRDAKALSRGPALSTLRCTSRAAAVFIGDAATRDLLARRAPSASATAWSRLL